MTKWSNNHALNPSVIKPKARSRIFHSSFGQSTKTSPYKLRSDTAVGNLMKNEAPMQRPVPNNASLAVKLFPFNASSLTKA